jgi:pimeloyl-ACP methyl ester carboxylesterase
MTAITNLYGKYYYKTSQTDMPILLVMHGWTQGVADIPESDLLRLAGYDLFVCALGMRGEDGADGASDASGREIYDIYDAIAYIRTNFAAQVSSDKVAVVGYSGGGGNALACACKFPDTFNCVISYFGPSDYGRDGTDGWYQNNGGGFAAGIASAVGGTPAAAPNNYYTRDTTAAIANYTSGFLYLYHDDQDTLVPSVHSDRIGTALDNASLTNYSKNISTTTDSIRWTHGYPAERPDLIIAEQTWIAKIKSEAAWTIAASGTVTVIGYIVTKRFTIWLNANGTAITGVDAAATVVYNTATDTYTVTPLVSGIDVSVTQGAKTGSASNISAETEIVVT